MVATIDDADGVAALLEERLLKATSRDGVRLSVNGAPVSMKPFVQDFVRGTVRGMLSALTGVESDGTVVLRIERSDSGLGGQGEADAR